MNILQVSTNTNTNKYIESLKIMRETFINTIEATRRLERVLKILNQ